MKKHMFKRFLALILALCMLPVIHLEANATTISNGTFGDNLTWSLTDDGILTIYGEGNMPDCSESSTAPWYTHRENILSAVIEEGIINIGQYTFQDCTELTSVTIPESVFVIGRNAFSGCSSLTDIAIPESVVSIGVFAFENCSSLTDITIPEGVTLIFSSTFSGCSSLTDIALPGSVTYIGTSAFYGCSSLTDIALPGSVTFIGGSAFYGCSGLTEFTVPDGVTSIASYTFYGCSALSSVTIPEGVTTISYYSFDNCSEIIDVFFGGTEDAWAALYYTPDADFVHYETTEPEGHWTVTTVPATCTEDGYTTAVCACGYEKSREPIISSGHDYVDGVCSVCGCSKLTAGTCGTGVFWRLDGDTLTIYGEGAMDDYSGSSVPWIDSWFDISNLVIEDGVTSIGEKSFVMYTFDSFSIASSVSHIGDYAFMYCTLPAITLPEGVSTLGEGAFYGCELPGIKFPDSLTAIGAEAFNGCSALTSVTIPEGVTVIEAYAFASCANLEEVNLPDTLTEIGESAFNFCYNLPTIVIPDGIETIGADAFNCCYGLASVFIPDSVESIGNDAFYACYDLIDVYFGGTEDYWSALENTPTAACVHYSVTDPANHWYEDGKDATCTEDGYTRTICACGYGKNSTVVTSQGHNFVDGTCSVCGEPDPDATHPMLETVTRVYGSNRYDTSFMSADTLKDLMGVEKFQNIIVASGANFPDALAGSYLASVKDAPILLVNNGTVESVKTYIRENLAPGGTVYLLGGTGVVPVSMETGLTGFTVKRLGGATRYDTNLQILQEAGIGDRDILVCTGTGFADSLSASAVGLPILLVGTSLTSAQRSLLSTCSGSIIIVGGWGAVSDYVASQLAAYGPVERLSGSTRYETSTMVAERFFDDPTNAVLAYAENFPDGLSGGPIANRIGAPLILTMSGRESAAASYTSRNGINHGIILGGPTLIGDKAIRSVFSLGSDVTIATR